MLGDRNRLTLPVGSRRALACAVAGISGAAVAVLLFRRRKRLAKRLFSPTKDASKSAEAEAAQVSTECKEIRMIRPSGHAVDVNLVEARTGADAKRYVADALKLDKYDRLKLLCGCNAVANSQLLVDLKGDIVTVVVERFVERCFHGAFSTVTEEDFGTTWVAFVEVVLVTEDQRFLAIEVSKSMPGCEEDWTSIAYAAVDGTWEKGAAVGEYLLTDVARRMKIPISKKIIQKHLPDVQLGPCEHPWAPGTLCKTVEVCTDPRCHKMISENERKICMNMLRKR